MNSLSAKQQDKWKELDAFFKTNSKYYKQINNGNIVFTAWSAGGSGDYLNSLFFIICNNITNFTFFNII